jgi:hypothetical protein
VAARWATSQGLQSLWRTSEKTVGAGDRFLTPPKPTQYLLPTFGRKRIESPDHNYDKPTGSLQDAPDALRRDEKPVASREGILRMHGKALPMHDDNNPNSQLSQSLSDISFDLDPELDESVSSEPSNIVFATELQSHLLTQGPEVNLLHIDSPQQRLKKLYNLIGNCVVVPIPYGEKGPRDKEWQNVTFDQSLDPTYQDRIYECFTRGGNLGILLGPASYNLIDIDIDLDERVEPFLEVNPKLQLQLGSDLHLDRPPSHF